MGKTTIHVSSLRFQYPQATLPLFEYIDLTFAVGWTAILGANGAGKSTLLQLASGILKPEKGTVIRPDHTTYVAQRTDDPPSNFETFTGAYDREACRLHGLLQIDRDWFYRWETLSHGERKRVQIGCALYEEPEAITIDEPTNHLDEDAIRMVGDALESFKGIGILVSHDRALSDRLCTNTVIVHAPYVRVLHCRPSVALQESSRISESSQQTLQNARKQVSRITTELKRRSQIASVQDSRKSKRNIDAKDHDAKAKIDGARLSGADGKAGRLKAQMETRAVHLHSSLQEIQGGLVEANKLDLQGPVSGITIGSNPLKRDLIVRIPTGSLPLGPERKLFFDLLEIGPLDRVAITGKNGSGKSTFMQYLRSLISAQGIQVAYVPQEQELSACEQALQDLHVMDPTTKGRVLSSLTRLGSDPALIRSSVLASPGEAKKLLLSLLFEEPISVLLLDEPTNHLDLPSRLALQKALCDWEGSLVCISHDAAFLHAVCSKRWHIEAESEDILRLQKASFYDEKDEGSMAK